LAAARASGRALARVSADVGRDDQARHLWAAAGRRRFSGRRPRVVGRSRAARRFALGAGRRAVGADRKRSQKAARLLVGREHRHRSARRRRRPRSPELRTAIARSRRLRRSGPAYDQSRIVQVAVVPGQRERPARDRHAQHGGDGRPHQGHAAVCFVKAFGISFLAMPRSVRAAAAHEPHWSARAAIAALAVACLVFGFVAPATLGGLSTTLRTLPSLADAMPAVVTPLWLTSPNGIARVSPLLVGALILAVAGAAAIGLRGLTVRRAGTWGCGRIRQTARMEYTSSAFP